jgi:PAS domain S-box-containing protein
MTSPETRGCSVLIVEDEPIVAKDLQLMLRDMGYDAFAIAASADDAVKRSAERCPDLVLMDIRIKGKLDGIQTADILRRRFGVAVIYLTAHADEATIERAARTEPYGYLLKPIKTDELRSAVEVAAYKQKLDKVARERERRLNTALQSVHDAVITTDAEGRVTFLNAAAEAMIGSSSEGAIGRDSSDVMQMLDRDAIVAQTTSLPPEDSTARTRAIKHGNIIVLHDVGERRKLQKQLEMADRLSSLGAMTASTAHELNNPLTVVMTNSGIVVEELRRLRDALESPASRDLAPSRLTRIEGAMGDLQAAAIRMARVVADLRAFSRPAESGTDRVDLKRCVEWAVRATAHEFQHRAQIHTRFAPAPLALGEHSRIEQVLVNLLVNAAHAIAPGNVKQNEVTVSVRTAEDGRALIEVRDTGAGIPLEAMRRIFEPFFTTKPPGIGTGLGLAICQGIVKALGGEILAASAPGSGTTFTVLLQAAPPGESSVDPDVIDEPVAASTRRGRILVLDDEVALLRAMQFVLEGDGHEVVCRDSAHGAVNLIEKGEIFDLILSDLMLPGMNGADFFESVRARNPALARRIVFVTGGAVTPRMAAFLASVPNARLEKPFKVGQLSKLVSEGLQGKLSDTQGAPVS